MYSAIVRRNISLGIFPTTREGAGAFYIISRLVEHGHISQAVHTFTRCLSSFSVRYRLGVVNSKSRHIGLRHLIERLNVRHSIAFCKRLSRQALRHCLKRTGTVLIDARGSGDVVSVIRSVTDTAPIVAASVPLGTDCVELRQLNVIGSN